MVATQNDPLLGKTLGQVKITSRLGAGAMGVVYRGWHQRLDREVAVKLLISNRQDKPTYRERFLREGRAAAKVHNDHVVQVLDAGQEGETAYLVMEFVNGHSLGDILDEAKMLPADVVIQLGAGIALGLAAIHEKGIVHRDIKPDNILVGTDKKPRVADLGLAKQISDPELNRLTATGVVVGTPLYVSPEGIRDPSTICDRSDVYSLGATLYHMLTGKPPFRGDTPYEVMHGHLQGKVTPVRTMRPEIPEGLATLVERCLAKEPTRRPTAMELAELLMQGGKAPPGSGKGLLVMVAIVMLGLGGVAAWFLMPKAPITEITPGTAAPTANQGSLVVDAVVDGLRVLLNGREITPGATIALDPGEHRLMAETTQPGPLLRAATSLAVTTGATSTWHPDLQPVPVTSVRVPIPGTGLILRDGRPFGMDPALSFDRAGTYSVARWNGKAWTQATITLRDDGSVDTPSWATNDLPQASAYWATTTNNGQHTRPHHVVSWWEAEQARTAAGLPAPVGWTAQSSSPEVPTSNAPATIVQAYVDLARPWGADLPKRDTALELARLLGSSIWCREQGALARVGGLGGAPLLVLVPSKP